MCFEGRGGEVIIIKSTSKCQYWVLECSKTDPGLKARWPQRLGLGTRSEELMKKDKLQEQKGGHSDFLGSVFLLLA